MRKPCICFIKEEYFLERPHFRNMVDSGDAGKQSRRSYLCVEVELDGRKVYVPLRSNLGEPVRRFGVIGFAVPSLSRPRAGLDYRHSLVIDDSRYIEYPAELRIPLGQYRIIAEKYGVIEKEVREYVAKYVKVAKKGRVEQEPRFRCSSLVNFDEELGVSPAAEA